MMEMKTNTYKIYAIVNLMTDMPVYIGSTKMSLERRFSNHATIKNCTMYETLEKQKRKNFKIVKLTTAVTKEEALRKEEEYTHWFMDFLELKNKDIANRFSAEHKQKIGYAHQGVSNSKLYKKIKCITTNEVFESVKAASKKYNIPSGNIVFVCQGRRASAGNKKWEYVN